MTVSAETASISYAGNGATTAFSVPYYFLENSHLLVTLRSTTGTESVKVLTTDYTVSGAGTNPSTATLTMIVTPATGETLRIERNVPSTQETDYVENDSFPAESHERALDKLTMLIQQGETAMGRALRLPATSPVSTELSEPEALQFPVVNSDKTGFDWVDAAVGVPAGEDLIKVSNVATMKALTGLVDGSSIRRLGYYSVNDGGADDLTYYATPPGTEDDGTWFDQTTGGGQFVSNTQSAIISARKYGVKADGTTDDYDRLNAAKVAAANKALFLDFSGTSILGTRLELDEPITIYGLGWETVLKGDAAGTHIIVYARDAAGIQGVFLRDFKVDGNNGGQLDTGLVQITTANFVIERLWVTGTTKASGTSGVNGIAVSSESGLEGTYGSGTIRDCVVNDVTKPGIYWSSYLVGGTVEGNKVYNCSGNGSATGISVAGKNCRVISNEVYDCEGHGIFLFATSTPSTPDRTIVSGNICYGNGTGSSEGAGIAVATAFGTNYGRIIISNNICFDNGVTAQMPGIYVASEDNVIIESNWCYDNGWHGILVQDSINTEIANNVCEQNNNQNVANGAGIAIRNTCSGIRIIDNKCFDTLSGASKTQDYGISFVSGTLSDITFRGNRLYDHSTGEILFGAVPTRMEMDHIYNVSTTDATLTNVILFTPPSDTACVVNTIALAKETGGASDGAASWQLSATIWNDGGTIAQIGANTTIASKLSANATTESWTHLIDDNTGASVRVRIRGGSSSNLTWKVAVNMLTL